MHLKFVETVHNPLLAEFEFKSEYLALRKQCQEFATSLLDHTRSGRDYRRFITEELQEKLQGKFLKYLQEHLRAGDNPEPRP